MASCASNVHGSLKMLSCCADKRYCSNIVVNSILERATRPRRESLISPPPPGAAASNVATATSKNAQPNMWRKYFNIRYRRKESSYRPRTESDCSTGSSSACSATTHTEASYTVSLSETCGLSISELEAMAARQARQLETQEQLLAAKAQRLRFLKSGGEAERLQRLREKVASQEERLRKLRALRGKVQTNRNTNSVLSSDLESLRAVFNEKEKELSLAVAKVDELTRQLEDLRRSNKDKPPNGQQSAAAAELEKLRRELMYRQKLREAQATRVAAQRAALNQRQEETMRVDRRIAELQERLHRKRVLNQQLAATLKHQENTDDCDFVSVPNKNDPKYQTLPYNAKLFHAPFANKHEQDQFEKSMQQMQIIQADHHNHGSHQISSQHQNNQHNHNNHHQQQHQQPFLQHQQQNGSSSGVTSNYQSHHNYNTGGTSAGVNGTIEPPTPNNNGIQSVSGNVDASGNGSNGGNHINNSSSATISSLQQLHHLLSISGGLNQNAKSANLQQQQSYGNDVGGSLASSNNSNGSNAPASVSTTMTTSTGVPNGLQTVHSTQANNNVSRGKAVPIIGSVGLGNNANGGSNKDSTGIPHSFPVIRPSNFYPTGAPPSSSATSASATGSLNSGSSTVTSTTTATNNGSIINTGMSSIPIGSMMPLAPSSRVNGLINSQVPTCGSNGNSLDISLTGTNSASLSSTSSNDTGFVSSGSNSSSNWQQQQQSLQQQQLKPALPPKPAKPTPPPRQAHDLFNFNMRSGSADNVLHDRSDMSMKPKSLFVKSSSVQPSSDNGSASQPMDKDPSNNSTVRVSINRRIEMPPAFLFPESDPPPSDLVPEHQQQQPSTSSVSSLMSNTFSSTAMERQQQQQHHSSTENTTNNHHQSSQQQQQHQQQLLQLSPVSSASVDSVDASSLLPKGPSGFNHHHQQLLPEEYTLPDLFPPHPASSQGVFPPSTGSSSSGGNNKGDHYMNINNQINSHHMHRNAQALIESLGQHASQTSQILQQHTNTHAQQQQQRDAIDDNMMNGDRNSKRTDHNANSSGSANSANSQNVDGFKSGSGDGAEQSHSNFQLESSEAVNEKEGESCGNNINNNVILGERSGGAGVLDSEKDYSPSEIETVTANKGEGNINTSNPPGIVIAPAVTTVPGVLRRVKKSNFKSNNKDHIPIGRRVSFDPLALLLDASLEGELDLVVKTAGEVGNVSAANDEGITALHNAICAGHFDVVRFLVQFGCDVNAQDSDGWTPLHCAASCNNVSMVKFLVEHGACIFATTLSDHETAAEKCEEDEDGFGPCSEYLYSIQEKLGIMNGGVVYAVFEYDAQNSDELSFKEGERLVILRKGDEYEREWWWAQLAEKEGYVPRNLLGLYPRVMPQKRSDS